MASQHRANAFLEELQPRRIVSPNARRQTGDAQRERQLQKEPVDSHSVVS
jgi:hypothetical protein